MGVEAAITAIEALIGGRISRAEGLRAQHARGEAHPAHGLPDAVATPQTTAEVARIAEICHAERCPIVAWGQGTSLEGHVAAVAGGISLDFAEMNRVLAVHPEDLDVVVQPGITRKALDAELRATGLFFPVDPGADASIGGMAATRASGTCAVRYGTMREAVLALEVVLGDGRVIRTGTRARKSSAGYDLTRLFVGSEGTLGIMTEITLRLAGRPEAVAAATCDFPDIARAAEAVILTMQAGIPVARIELVDAVQIRASNAYSKLGLPERPHLFVEFHGSDAGVAEQAESWGLLAEEAGGANFAWASAAEQRTRLWAARHDAFWAAKATWPAHDVMATDVCVPISRLAEVVDLAQAEIAAEGLVAPLVGHAGDGNFHLQIMIPEGDASVTAAAQRVAERLVEQALDAGGTATGEHGIGLGKMKFMAREHGTALSVMADLKRMMDPANILNPGKMIALN